jgi:uncharacterized membrane protein
MQRRLESVTHIGRKIGLNDDKGYMVPVFLALIVVVAVVVGYYIFFVNSPPEEYNTIYLLDSQNQAIDYPQSLVAGQNSTFSVNVGVVNHMNMEHSYQVRTKIVSHFILTNEGVNATAVNTYDVTLASGVSNENAVTITENTLGSYAVVFELWQHDGNNYVFTQNYCVLYIQVTT